MISDLGFYIKLLSRRFPAMAALFLLCSCLGAILALRAPTTYSSTAVLLVEAPKIPDQLARSTVQVAALEQLDIIQQRLLTRAALISVARQSQIFENQSSMNPDVVVSEMRQNTSIRRSSGRNQATRMTLRFTGGDPRKVADVVNQYIDIVLEANSEFRTEQSEGTLEFFQQELDRLSQDLDLQSEKIVEFKRQNADALPENLDYRLSRRGQLQDLMDRNKERLETLETDRQRIQDIYQATGNVDQARAVPLSPDEQRLQTLEGELRVALSVYSETHPQARFLRNQIDALREQVLNAAPVESDDSGPQRNESLNVLGIRLADMDAEEDKLKKQIDRATEQLNEVQDTIDRTPANQIVLAALERDQSNIQSQYSAAVQRLAQARLGVVIEDSARGERITVLEPANVPNTPSGPNRGGILAMGVASGLGLAVGLFVLLEILNTRIRRPLDINNSLGISTLAAIPRLDIAADRMRRRTIQLVTLVAIMITVPLSVWAVDSYFMPVDVLVQKVMRRLL